MENRWWQKDRRGRLALLSAPLAPAIALLGLFLIILALAMIIDNHGAYNIRLTAFRVTMVTRVLLPALPLLAGAAPFLRKPQPSC